MCKGSEYWIAPRCSICFRNHAYCFNFAITPCICSVHEKKNKCYRRDSRRRRRLGPGGGKEPFFTPPKIPARRPPRPRSFHQDKDYPHRQSLAVLRLALSPLQQRIQDATTFISAHLSATKTGLEKYIVGGRTVPPTSRTTLLVVTTERGSG